MFPHFYPPVGRRVGRIKMTAGFQNNIDAKKPDSRKNQAFLELLARFELATSSLPTALEYKNRCIPAFMACFSWRKVRIPSFFTPALFIPFFASWVKPGVRNPKTFLQTTESAASHYRVLLRIVASSAGKVKSRAIKLRCIKQR